MCGGHLKKTCINHQEKVCNSEAVFFIQLFPKRTGQEELSQEKKISHLKPKQTKNPQQQTQVPILKILL